MRAHTSSKRKKEKLWFYSHSCIVIVLHGILWYMAWYGIACDCIGMLFLYRHTHARTHKHTAEVHRLESALSSRKEIWTTKVTTVIFHRSVTLYYAVELFIIFPPLLPHSVRVSIVFQCIHNKVPMHFYFARYNGNRFQSMYKSEFTMNKSRGGELRSKEKVFRDLVCQCVSFHIIMFSCVDCIHNICTPQIRHRFYGICYIVRRVSLKIFVMWRIVVIVPVQWRHTHTYIQADNNQNNVLSVPLCKSNRKRMEFLQWCCFYYMRVRVRLCVCVCVYAYACALFIVLFCFVSFYFKPLFLSC